MFATFSLFQILYLPEDGIDDVPVGDELLEWMNTHYIEPSTEEGNRLSGHERPWEDDIFWPYLIRYFHSASLNTHLLTYCKGYCPWLNEVLHIFPSESL